jgi:hypothetical protein
LRLGALWSHAFSWLRGSIQRSTQGRFNAARGFFFAVLVVWFLIVHGEDLTITETTPERIYSELELETGGKHYRAVGLVAGTWASFELVIDTNALELAKIPFDPGLCLTAQIMGSANKLNAYMAIAQLRGAKRAIGELEIFAKDTTALSERRNRTIHDPWLLKEGFPHRYEITAKRKLRRLFVPALTPNIEKLSTEIAAHIQRFEAIHSRAMTEVAA